METIDHFLKTRYHQHIPSLFAAIYEKDMLAGKDNLITILTDIIVKYPTRPTEEDKEAKKDWSTLELLVIYFDIEYEAWLSRHQYPFISVKPLETNEYLLTVLNSEDYQFFDDIIFSMMHYLAGYKTSKEYEYFTQALSNYKNLQKQMAKASY